MAERRASGTAPWLAFLIGALLVAVLVLGWLAASGGRLPIAQREVDVNVELPDAPKMPDVGRSEVVAR